MTDIVQKGHAVLHEKAAAVPIEQIATAKIQQVIADMRQALATQQDGAAIAAPQIGIPLRIFIVSHRILKTEDGAAPEDQVYINPEIVKTSRQKELMEEGCLSVRGTYGKVKRATRATVRAYDEHGKQFTRGASGVLAQAFQHECDHLDGTLFDDKAQEVWHASSESDANPR